MPAWIGLIIMRINFKDFGKNLSKFNMYYEIFYVQSTCMYINSGSCSLKVECISVF